MISKSRLNRIITLALPIIGGMVSQNVLNLVDTAMVGTLGDAALAAVGMGSFANFFCQALILGISTGVQATSSRRKGEGKIDLMATPLNTGLVIVLVCGALLTLVLYQVIPFLYPFLNSDPNVVAFGAPYLQIRVLAIVFVGMNFAFRGYFNGVDLPKVYMATLITMHISNLLLNYLLIFGNFGFPKLGVSGAALGTTLATAFGSLVYFFYALKLARKNGFLKELPTIKEITSMIKLSLPSGIQQMFFAAGFTALYWIIGQIGTRELAASNVLVNLILICVLPGLGLGIASASLVGQALGNGNPDDAEAWAWDVVKVGGAFLAVASLPLILPPQLLLAIFIHDPITLELATLPVRVAGATICIDAAGLILLNSLAGAGDTKTVMFVSIFLQWFLFLPLAYLLGPFLGGSLLTIWVLHVGYRSLQALIFGILWKRGKWKGISV
ncbi:MAG: MATE family efflux transporter [Halobacteriovoraceae bacterium]|nr:MATE family efflux transporter [Halobacteriovoraceae bacterium]